MSSPPPAPSTALIGRTAEIAAVGELLVAARLVTLTGPPGVGKTRLALAVAQAQDNVAWVDLTAVREARLVEVEIARAIDIKADPDVLLLVDNWEHLLDAAPQLAQLIATTTKLQVLATSRERLRIAAECEYPVPPLPMPSEPEVAQWQRLRDNPAVAVLLARAPAAAVRTRPRHTWHPCCATDLSGRRAAIGGDRYDGHAG